MQGEEKSQEESNNDSSVEGSGAIMFKDKKVYVFLNSAFYSIGLASLQFFLHTNLDQGLAGYFGILLDLWHKKGMDTQTWLIGLLKAAEKGIAILTCFLILRTQIMQCQLSPFTLIMHEDCANHLPGDVQRHLCSSDLYTSFWSKQSCQSATCIILNFLDGTPRFTESVNTVPHLHRHELLQAVHKGGIVKGSM